LALKQTQIVVEALRSVYPRTEVRVIPIRTSGDRIQDASVLRKAGKGLFAKEIEQALLRRKISLAVHSFKDLPSEQPDGLVIGAVLERKEAADGYIANSPVSLDKAPPGTVVGTSSLRRQAQLREFAPHVRVVELKGNLDTRLEALRSRRTKLQGIVVAAAGVLRLYPPNNGQAVRMELLCKDRFVPCPAQGALCVEVCEGNERLREMLRAIDHPQTAAAVSAERHLMRRLEGGCQIPLGVHARPISDGMLQLLRVNAYLGLPDGKRSVRAEATGSLDDPVAVAENLETLLRARGASSLLEELSDRYRMGPGRLGLGVSAAKARRGSSARARKRTGHSRRAGRGRRAKR